MPIHSPSFLAVESSDAYSSVAIWREERLCVRESTTHNDHAEVLTTMIASALDEMEISLNDLAAIGISQGPGSYTGLRIGYATVKGLCFASRIPLIAIPTLAALAGAIEREANLSPKDDNYCCIPMIDARRMEVYTQTFLPGLRAISEPYPCILDEKFPDRPADRHAYYAGNGAEKAKNLFPAADWTFVDYPTVRAKDLLPILEARYLEHLFEDLAYTEPLYVKDFEATPSRRTPLCNLRATLSDGNSAE